MPLSQDVAQKLLQINAIKLSPQKPFTWASGWLSPIYCDNRLTLSYPEIRKLIREGLAQRAEQFKPFDVVVGVATAGIPHGVLLAEELNLPFAYVRSKPKEHGRQNQIEGRIEPGQKALVVEDLISTGGSLIKAIEPVRDAGVEISGALAIFTYGFAQSIERMSDAQVGFDTLSNYDVLIEEAINLSYIHKDDLDTLKDWKNSPQNWKPIG